MKNRFITAGLVAGHLMACSAASKGVGEDSPALKTQEPAKNDAEEIVAISDLKSSQLEQCINAHSNNPDNLLLECKDTDAEAERCRQQVENEVIKTNQHIPACHKAANDPGSWDAPVQCLNSVMDPVTGEKALHKYEVACKTQIEKYSQCLRDQIGANGIECQKKDVTKKLLIDVD